MNERILELVDHADPTIYDQLDANTLDPFLEKFAELIRADEREECAKLCEALAEEVRDWADPSSYENAALFIRARGEPK